MHLSTFLGLENLGRLSCAFFALATIALAPGCAVMKATEQPNRKDLGVLAPGIPRNHVIAELGAPVWTEQRDGQTTDVFAFKQGYSRGEKAGRALVHGAADVATFGLWEVVGVPFETWAAGTDVQVEVGYDDRRMVESVTVIRGKEAIESRGLFARRARRGDDVAQSNPPAAPPPVEQTGYAEKTSKR